MPQYFILAQSETTARALGEWLELLGEPPVKDPDKDSRVIVQKEQTVGSEERPILAYEALVRQIETRTAAQHGAIPLNEVVILVDSVKPASMNPLTDGDGGGWYALLGMLILTFPEIHWVFGVIGNDTSIIDLRAYHTLSSLLAKPRRDPLFDATGLRNSVRVSINNAIDDGNLPVRKHTAAAIDEEVSYALFHAYAAYRFGYRADAVRSWVLMGHLFSETAEKHEFDLLLEDVNLNFPDKPERTHLSTFAEYKHDKDGQTGRAKHCPRLAQGEPSRFRIIVTSGHSGADAEKMRKNREFVEADKGRERCGYVLKPVGGIFDLWTQAKLFKRLPRRKEAGHRIQPGYAPGFYWPPPSTELAEESGGHSAPGKLMLIAQHLVRRADALRDFANTVDECIRGAVLATDALELLRYQTPTLALQALSLKHEFEVKAEVAFLGVGHHFDLTRRLDELECEVKTASRYFQKRRRRAAELDTLVSIGNRLMLVFREAGQFDEEQICLARVRAWHRKLKRIQERNPIDFVANGVMGYAEWLLASSTHFFSALVFWYIALVGLWWWGGFQEKEGLLDCALSAWKAFTVGESSFDSAKVLLPEHFVLHIVASAAGLFHFGVFISYLYSNVTRK